MKVIVTRPAAQADEWVARLRSAGVDAVALPLIEIGAAPDPAAVQAAWRSLETHALIVFVSPSAAQRFFAVRPDGTGWPGSTRAASIGPGTTRALLAAGVPTSHIVAPDDAAQQYDSEALWSRLRAADWRGASVLFARGDGGRDWLADRLREAGAGVAMLAVYRRGAPALERPQRAVLDAARAAPRDHLWLFSSSEAIDHLEAAAGPHDWSAARAIATHPRIAERARALGIGELRTPRAEFDAVLACILSAP